MTTTTVGQAPDLYSRARQVRVARAVISGGLPLAALVVQIGSFAVTNTVGAIAGAWLLVDRLAVRRLEDSLKHKGAEAQAAAEEVKYSGGIDRPTGGSVGSAGPQIVPKTPDEVLVSQGRGC